MIKFVLVARNDKIGALVQQCAAGQIPFSGPDSLCARVSAMGYSTNSLYYMVRAAEEELRSQNESPKGRLSNLD